MEFKFSKRAEEYRARLVAFLETSERGFLR